MRWLGFLLLLLSCRRAPPAPPPPSRCVDCHAAQSAQVSASHHGRGQAVARFANVPEGSVGAWRVSHDGGVWLSEVDGGTWRAGLTIGVEPLFQVAVQFSDGRLQVPPIAYARDGGWLLLDSVGDWRGPSYNWNGSCAPCHATAFRVGVDAGGFSSEWAELSVGCAACHGTSAGHPLDGGFSHALRTPEFAFVDGGAIASLVTNHEFDEGTCQACHSRRRALRDDGVVDGAFLNRFEPMLLTKHVFHANGAVEDEVFESSSFSMSRMHAAGVRCTNCHDAHTGQLRAQGNALCLQCHRAEVFDVTTHHGHAPSSSGAQCVACHMPSKTFMRVHVRHDHSLRVPRPLEAERVGAPDVCASCHPNSSAADHAKTISTWTGRAPAPDVVARVFGASFAEQRDAGLCDVVSSSASSFERASALALLANAWSPCAAEAVRGAASSDDSLIRYGAARALAGASPTERVALGTPLLHDAMRAVRVQAARVLVGLVQLTPSLRSELDEAEAANAFRGDAWLNRSAQALAVGDRAGAERALRRGLTVDPSFAPLRINLADLVRQNEGEEAARALLAPVEQGPWASPVAYALGLSWWRSHEPLRALEAFDRARRDGSAQHLQAWCLAVRSVRGPKEGAAALAEAMRVRPNNALLEALRDSWK